MKYSLLIGIFCDAIFISYSLKKIIMASWIARKCLDVFRERFRFLFAFCLWLMSINISDDEYEL